jgi:hypothetical protein
MKALFDDEEFITLFQMCNSNPGNLAAETGMSVRAIQLRRNSIEAKYQHSLDTVTIRERITPKPERINLGIENGTVIVFSDAHFWPGIKTTAYKGLIWAIQNLENIKAVVNNGDAFDGASISRFPRIGWDSTPSLIGELKACEIALGEIEDEAKKVNHKMKLIWPLGNHDARFENRLAANAPQYEYIKGFSLKDHFPAWQPCWSTWLTQDVIVKHRWKGGVHATHNNTVNSGVTMITGHLHSLKVTPFDDYNGTRYGVDTGTLADPYGPQFENYLENSPTNWRSGFVVLTFYQGQLLWPEVVKVVDKTHVEFRGKVIKV